MRRSLLLLGLTASASFASAQIVTDWRTATLAAGSWAYRPVTDGSEAVFTDARVTPRVVVKCSRSRRSITLTLVSAVSSSAITLAATDTQRTLPASFNAQTSQIIAQIAGNDALLDALAFSRGRFALSVAGSAALVVPASPEVARSIEDCRI